MGSSIEIEMKDEEKMKTKSVCGSAAWLWNLSLQGRMKKGYRDARRAVRIKNVFGVNVR